MTLGFEFRQTMAGTYHRLEASGDERPMSITCRAEVHDLRRFLLDPTAEISGEVDAQGLADHRPMHGTLEISPVLRRKLVYEFRFPDDEGNEHRFHGEQEIEPRHLLETVTTLPGSIYRGQVEVARAILRFDLHRDLVRLLRSFRPT